MVLDVEASLFAHILHIVSKVADKTFLTQLRRDSCFQRNNIAAHQLKSLDIQFFEYLFAQAMQCLFFAWAGNTHIKRVERLAYFDLRLLTCRATKTDDTHNQVCLACQLLIDKFLIDLGPVTQVYTEWRLRADVTYKILVKFLRHMRYEWRQ